MQMKGGIDHDRTLDYVEFQIFPRHNRYEASVWSSNKKEKVASGILELLLLHSPQAKELSSKESDTNFKIFPPDNLDNPDWFTTATLKRFLCIIGLPDILSIGNEISQLEASRKYQISLSEKAEDDLTSVESKNELLQAVDLKLTTLKEELATAFNWATGSKCSPKDISDLGNFALHFGAKNLRDSLQKCVDDLRNSSFSKARIPQPSELDPPVKYGVSPVKAVEIERDSSAGENSAFSSEEDQPSVGRSQTLGKSATPRRSASPMRRVQIGRSGSRRATALSIKSLYYFPAREKEASQRQADGGSSEEEDSEKPLKNSVVRMSVQDKISLFESKQRDQGIDVQKTKASLNATFGLKKAVLRRWSSGMSETAAQCYPDSSTEASSPISSKNVAPDGKTEPDINISKGQSHAKSAENINSLSPKKGTSVPFGVEVAALEPEREESREKLPAVGEWSQQKGAELNEMIMKMMESKAVRRQNVNGDTIKSKNLKEQRLGFFDLYKQKREAKLQAEASGKKVEKEDLFKVMQRSVDEKKPKMASTNASGVVNRRQTTMTEPQKTPKNSTHLINSRTSKPSTVKKTTPKSSPLPSTRKSWSSTPSPAKTPTGPTSTARRPLSASSVVRSSTKSEILQPRSNTRIKAVSEKQQPGVTKNTKMKEGKVMTPNVGTTVTSKPSFYNKVAKKSSVVPLETKPFLRKGSGISPGAGPVICKTKVVAQPEGALRRSGGLIQAEENKVVARAGITNQNHKHECGTPENCVDSGVAGPQLVSPTKLDESESSNQYVSGDDDLKRFEVSINSTASEEELGISLSAWVEIEEHDQNAPVSCTESLVKNASPANGASPARFSRPRHHSLSMLLEERNGSDISEWGNREHPPTMIYQKDAPKGLKRLLNFARKTKADSHLSGRSSPLGFSEGEDDAEESKGQLNLSRFTVQNHQRLSDGNVPASVNTTKATRSFFSLSAFRGNKMNETNLQR